MAGIRTEIDYYLIIVPFPSSGKFIHQPLKPADELAAEGGFLLDVAADHLDEGVTLELAPHLLEVAVALADRTVDTEADARNHRELLAGIVVKQTVELDHRLVPLPHDGNNVLRGEPVDTLPIPAAHLRAHPGPLHVVVAAVQVAEVGFGLLEGVTVVTNDAIDFGLDGLFGQDEPRQVYPLAQTQRVGRLQPAVQVGDVGEGSPLETLDDGVAHELVHGQRVEVYPLLERTVPDGSTLERVALGGFARGLLEPLQGVDALQHLLDGIGAEQVEVDAVELVGVGATVALGPLLGIAYGAHALEVSPRHEVGVHAVLDQVGEGHARGIGVVDVPPHDERESPYPGGPQHVGVAGSLRPALDHTLVDGPQLVHVVTLVRPAAGIQEREHAGNEQARLVHGHRVGAGKDGAGLAVLALTVAEEERVVGREEVRKVAGLPHEATRQYRAVAHAGARADDEILCGDVGPDGYGGLGATIDSAVVEARGAVDAAGIADAEVAYRPRVDDVHAAAYGAAVARHGGGIVGHQLPEPPDEVGPVAIHGHEVGHLCREAVVDGDLAATRLVEHRHLGAVAEGALPLGKQQVHVLDVAVVAYAIVGDVVGHPLDEGVVAHRAVVQGDVVQPGASGESARQGEVFFEYPQPHLPRESGVGNGFGHEAFGYKHLAPVVGHATLGCEPADF